MSTTPPFPELHASRHARTSLRSAFRELAVAVAAGGIIGAVAAEASNSYGAAWPVLGVGLALAVSLLARTRPFLGALLAIFSAFIAALAILTVSLINDGRHGFLDSKRFFLGAMYLGLLLAAPGFMAALLVAGVRRFLVPAGSTD